MAHAPPASRDGFAFGSNCFSVTTSGGHVHRRHTLPELKAHFKNQKEDHPAHWYEAQLMHYGLPPSKVKGTAKMRLMGAVMGDGKLQVPAPLSALERELKKEWTKANKAAAATASPSKPADSLSKKRKASTAADIRVVAGNGANLSVSVMFNSSAGSSQPTTKRAKTEPVSTQPSQPIATFKEPKRKTPEDRKQLGYRTKQTDRKGVPPPSPSRNSDSQRKTQEDRKQLGYRTKQTARKRVPPPSPPRYNDSPPPPYPGSPTTGGYDDNSGTGTLTSSPAVRSGQSTQTSLGYLNGRYEIVSIDCPDRYYPSDTTPTLVCTLDGDALWVDFDFGFLGGVMRTDRRPRRASDDDIRFDWCGYSEMTDQTYDGGRAWLAFVGGGVIEGAIEWDRHGRDTTARFKAQRLEGQSTRSEISAREMQERWEKYRDDYDDADEGQW